MPDDDNIPESTYIIHIYQNTQVDYNTASYLDEYSHFFYARLINLWNNDNDLKISDNIY